MAQFLSRRWQLDRRRVLRGLGATIALPLLQCMRSTGENASASQRAGNPPPGTFRSVFIYLPNGVNTLTWQIESSGRDYTLSEPLRSLQGLRDVLTPISGLHHPAAIGKGHLCDQTWLTSATIADDIANFRNTISADQVIASAIGERTRYPSLELTVTGGSLSWDAQGVSRPAFRRPSEVFQRLFIADTGGVASRREALRRRASVLDAVLDDARSLSDSLGLQDQRKLAEYLQSVREVELRTQRADAWLEKPIPAISDSAARQVNRNVADAEAGDYYRTLYDLMVLALQTDMTRVITCMSGSESHSLALPEIGIEQSRHELSHHNGDAEQMRRLTRCDQFLVEQFAYFLEQMRRRDEDGTSLLDETVVLFGSGMSYGHSHGNANLPIILAGGSAMGFQHGRHVDFNLPAIGSYHLANSRDHYQLCMRPVDSQARLSNLLLTIIQQMQVDVDSFGDSVSSMRALLS